MFPSVVPHIKKSNDKLKQCPIFNRRNIDFRPEINGERERERDISNEVSFQLQLFYYFQWLLIKSRGKQLKTGQLKPQEWNAQVGFGVE